MSAYAMRAWRADPENRARELDARRAGYDPTKARANRERYEETHHDVILDRKREAYDGLKARVWHLKNKYGATLVGWLATFYFQGERCACCGAREPGGKRWHTDHDHNALAAHIRGIVCHHCNIMLGGARDKAERLAQGQRYLEARR